MLFVTAFAKQRESVHQSTSKSPTSNSTYLCITSGRQLVWTPLGLLYIKEGGRSKEVKRPCRRPSRLLFLSMRATAKTKNFAIPFAGRARFSSKPPTSPRALLRDFCARHGDS